MTAEDLVDSDIPVKAPPDAESNARSLRSKAGGIHDDTLPGDLGPDFQFFLKVPREDKPPKLYGRQRALRRVHGPTGSPPTATPE